MSQQPEIIFDQQEMDLMFNRELFPLKRHINQKLYVLFEQIKTHLKDSPIHGEFSFPAQSDLTTGKISQGENHNKFPWVILDFPKLFQPEKIFAYRTLFWFGSGFSNSIIISGSCCDQFLPALIINQQKLHGHQIYFSFSPDPWNHEVGGADSALIETIETNQIRSHAETNGFVKLSNAYHFNEGAEIRTRSVENYNLLLSALL